MTRYTIDPANFTEGQWEEMHNLGTMVPRSMETRDKARPFKRPKKFIKLFVACLLDRAEEVRDMHDDELWAKDLEQAAETLQGIIGPDRITKRDARKRLWDLLYSDIYTDAPEYSDRVEEIHALIPIALK